MSTAAANSQTGLSDLVAEEIRVMMIRRRTTGRKLARALGVSPSWLSYRLTGVQEIGLNDLERIADALGVPIRDLLPPDTSSERAAQPTVRKPALTETTMIPHPRVSHPPFGGAVRTRPLSDIDQMTEPNRVVPASVWADRSAVGHYDPATPMW